MKPETKHGVLKEITGPGVRWDEIEICPARVELDGNGWAPELGLSGFLQAGFAGTGAVKALCRKRIEAVWVLGRLMQLFDLPLVATVDRCEKSMMDYQFVAICREQTGFVVSCLLPGYFRL
jgi:hypothetical protein